MELLIDPPHGAKTHLPGESGVWLFIIGDLIVFGLFFVVFVYHRALVLRSTIIVCYWAGT